jgi:hypothetical protein
MVALSSTEAKYKALMEGNKKIVWLRNLIGKLDLLLKLQP